MIEVYLFGAVGVLLITTAALMLLSENAVHSALFLIVNFIGVALLFLMLEAPFLALVQIAVYAGAIMVLFLFVIMLLGAEKTGRGASIRRFPWLAPLAMGLTVFFIIAVGWAMTQGQIDSRQAPPGNGVVRFVHAAPAEAIELAQAPAAEEAATSETPAEEAPAEETAADTVPTRPDVAPLPADRVFTLAVDGEVIADAFAFGDATDFIDLEPGSHTVSLANADGQEVLSAQLDVEADAVLNVVVAGETALDVIVAPQTTESGLTIINANPSPSVLEIGDLQNPLFDDSRVVNPVVTELAYGQAVEGLDYPPGFTNWIIFEAGRAEAVQEGNTAPVLFRFSEVIAPAAGADGVYVFSPDRRPDGNLRPIVTPLDLYAATPFGSPNALGEQLFVGYLLPFQLVAMLLLAAMVGVIVITYRGEHVPKPSRTTRRKVSRPLTSVIASQTGAELTSGAPQLPERSETPAGD
ncbi:MAG: NADH-quinone oxidoreductase subunit J [Chloroflexi bacterium]|nr:NADH-quinone oxidoreductase subunit J [Chloroflexota bacterium]